MSSIQSSPSDSVDLADTCYYFAGFIPGLDTCLSLYELFKKSMVNEKYTGELGEKYPSLSEKYFVRKSYEEISCRIIPFFGQFALLGLYLFNKLKGSELHKEALKDPVHSIPLLKEAANRFHHIDSIYLLGTYYRDGIGVPFDPELALTYFQEAEAAGDQRSAIAIGNLYLTGLGDGQPNAIVQDSQKAIESYRRANRANGSSLSRFAKYREEFVKVLLELGFKRAEMFDIINKSKGRFDTDFSNSEESTDLVIELASAFKDNTLKAVFNNEAKKLFQCAATYLPDGALKANTFYKLAQCTQSWTDYEKAAQLGSTEAAFDLSILKRDASKKIENADQADQLLSEAFQLLTSIPQEVLKKNFDISMQLGHYYLVFGRGIPQLEKAIECYKFCLDLTVLAVEKSPISFLIEFAGILREVNLKNKNQFDSVLKFLNHDEHLWEHLSLKGTTRLPLLMAQQFFSGQQLEKDVEIAEKLYELCTRQHDPVVKATAYYGLSQINRADIKITREHLENCIRFDPKHIQARLDLYSLIKDLYRQEADDFLQPAINGGVPEAFYLKGLTFIGDADKIPQKKPNFTFGQAQAYDNQKADLMKQAQDFLVGAAKLGHKEAKALCSTYGWRY